MLKRILRRRASAIDEDRWSLVARVREPGDTMLVNTPMHQIIGDEKAFGYLFLSEHALFTYLEHKGWSVRIPLPSITVLWPFSRPDAPMCLALRRDDDGESVLFLFELYPSPISAQLVDMLTSRLPEDALDRTDGKRIADRPS